MLENSILESALCVEYSRRFALEIFFSGFTYSDTSQTTPKLNIIPIYGGKPVMPLKTGTKAIAPNPTLSMVLLLKSRSDSSSITIFLRGTSPLKALSREAIKNGTMKQIIDGRITYKITLVAEIFPPIQSIVVVTSPIGDQAPPALAAITINEAYQIRN